MPFELPPLPYSANALEKAIDATTMEIHHDKHHAGYVSKANAALEGTKWADKPVQEVLTHLSDVPENIRTAVRNNAGGHANHSLFWTIMSPDGGGKPTGELASAIDEACGSFDKFKETFGGAGATRFGSGWAWLVATDNGRLAVGSTANQDSPLMGERIAGLGGTPLLGLDVWEHAYYLRYQNRRADYITAWWEVVNWDAVSERYASAQG